MARLQHQVSFVEEIDYSQLEFEKVVGKGTFGIVHRAKWRGQYVAVKNIESDEEIKAFRVEVLQLSRVSHPNIVTLYGACMSKPVCLVMEYAEGGSLYNILHLGPPHAIYTATAAMSWVTQCALGVTYLHSMKPKALIHRDLKPANLLLMAGGTILKICDFGTACDNQTYMTNNKGSAAWMAPEVFEGRIYNEKCDVFSWGIILWEVISRRKPFDEIGGHAFRIMWAVHEGTRPPMIRSIPKPLEKLMIRCWDQAPANRPSMAEVSRVMTHLLKYFPANEQPLRYETSARDSDKPNSVEDDLHVEDLCNESGQSSKVSTVHNTVLRVTLKDPDDLNKTPRPSADLTLDLSGDQTPHNLRPEASSRRRDPDYDRKRRSADFLSVGDEHETQAAASYHSTPRHRRSNSQGQILDAVTPPLQAPLEPVQLAPTTPNTPEVFAPLKRPHSTHVLQSESTSSGLAEFDPLKSRSNSDDAKYLSSDDRSTLARLSGLSLSTSSVKDAGWTAAGDSSLNRGAVTKYKGDTPRALRSFSLEQNHSGSYQEIFTQNAYMTLDHYLQPLLPNHNSLESQEIFNEHKQRAQELVRAQTEIALLHKRKCELADGLDQDFKDQQASFIMIAERDDLLRDTAALSEVHRNLRAQLDIIRAQAQRKQRNASNQL